jgi:hypothetical protein
LKPLLAKAEPLGVFAKTISLYILKKNYNTMTIPNPPNIEDANNFEKIPENNIRDFLTYALNSTRLILDSINSLQPVPACLT